MHEVIECVLVSVNQGEPWLRGTGFETETLINVPLEKGSVWFVLFNDTWSQ